MSKSFVLMFCLIVGLLLFGCSKSETTNREATAPAMNANKPAASPAATSPAATAEKIGVPECDAFITAYEACVRDKVPANVRAQFNTSLAQWRKSWHDLAANPTTKATLAAACKTQVDAAKQSMKPYGCTF